MNAKHRHNASFTIIVRFIVMGVAGLLTFTLLTPANAASGTPGTESSPSTTFINVALRGPHGTTDPVVAHGIWLAEPFTAEPPIGVVSNSAIIERSRPIPGGQSVERAVYYPNVNGDRGGIYFVYEIRGQGISRMLNPGGWYYATPEFDAVLRPMFNTQQPINIADQFRLIILAGGIIFIVGLGLRTIYRRPQAKPRLWSADTPK